VGKEDAFEQWRALGRALRKHREAAGLSVVQAAVRADFSESVWRQLEAGERRVGRDIEPPNPRTETLVRAAQAVSMDVNAALEMVGRPPVPTPAPQREALSGKIAQLSDEDAATVEGLVDRLLGT
jgi:transcriptional regulator with XRE-family HTH domain